jgi:hypothetical protein
LNSFLWIDDVFIGKVEAAFCNQLSMPFDHYFFMKEKDISPKFDAPTALSIENHVIVK